MPTGASVPATISFDHKAQQPHMVFAGEWHMQADELPEVESLYSQLSSGKGEITLDLQAVDRWDTTLVSTLFAIIRHCKNNNLTYSLQHAPEGLHTLLDIALNRPEAKQEAKQEIRGFFTRTGKWTLERKAELDHVMIFTGEIILSFTRLMRNQAYFRARDFVEALAEAGPRALAIVTLISFLVGLILAYIGSMQLKQFGAQIFVANLVGVAMLREMGALMTAIIMAGRTSASYAARIGTMQANEEIDALRTNGINPLDFLALPRLLALLVMVPVLGIYANAIGIFGGLVIGVGVLDLSVMEYWNQTLEAASLHDLWAGIIKSVVFAIVLGMAGCYHGLNSGRSSEAVGKVTTMAVVSAIVLIIITDSLLTVLYDLLGL